MSGSLIDCVKQEIENFVKENELKFLKIKHVEDIESKKPKAQYKCEKWMTT